MGIFWGLLEPAPRRGVGLLLVTSSLVHVGCTSNDCVDTLTCPSVDASAPDSSLDHAEGAVHDARDGYAAVEAGADAADAPVDASTDGRADTAPNEPVDALADAPVEAGPAAEASTPCNPSAPDCSNPACQPSFTCTPAVPTGWLGPVALYDQGGGPPTPTPASCSGVYAHDVLDGFASPTSPPLTCGCSCGSLDGGACSSAQIEVYAGISCLNECATAGPACSRACGSNCATGGQSVEVIAGPTATQDWSCSQGTTTTTTSWGWSHVGRGCESTQTFTTGGCGSGQICASTPPLSFQDTLCVYQNANVPDCTSAPGYPLLHTYYSSAKDGRRCAIGSCGCSAPSNPCELQSAQWFSLATGVQSFCDGTGAPPSSTCSSGGNPIETTVGVCNENLAGVAAIEATISVSGSCAPTGSAASTGSVTPDPTTAISVCCTQ